jgi:predicted NBD/HSP70 family sugar kinase
MNFRAEEGVGPRRDAPPAAAAPLRLRLYQTVRAAGQISRATLAKAAQVSPGSVTPAVSELLAQGLLREVEGADPDAPAPRGRPPVALAVAPGAGLVAGLKLSDRVHSAVMIDLSGRTVAEARLARAEEAGGLAALLGEAEALFGRLMAAAPVGRVLGLGLGLPGLVDHAAGALRWSPLVSERDAPLAAPLSARLGLPVAVDNDANLLTLAELWFGRGRDTSDFAVVTIEHGVGMGLVVDHALYRGAHGQGLELGHMKVRVDGALCRCGARGCLEAYVADYALVREAAVALEGPLPPRGEVLEALYAQAKAGNAAARAIFDRAGEVLAVGLANVAVLFDPARILLSGTRLRYDYLYAEEVLSRMAAATLVPPPPVEVHAWDDGVWARGAAALALDVATPALVAG